MKKLIWFLPLLSACGPSAEDVVDLFKHCNNEITVTYHKNDWSEGMEMTCKMSVPDVTDRQTEVD